MGAKLFVLVGALCIASGLCGVVPDATPAPAVQTNYLEELTKTVGQLQQTLSEQLKRVTNATIAEESKKAFQDQLSQLSTTLTEAVHNAGEKIVPTLKKGYEDTVKGVEDLRTKIQEGAQKA